MASSINASITSNGIVQTADASGNLQLQSDGTTALNINSGGKVVFPSTTLGTATAGTLEYNGTAPFFTPLGTQRGIIPGMQYYALNSGVAGSNATGSQSLFGVGVTLSASTIYAFQSLWAIAKTAGTTTHTVSMLFGGTATVNSIQYIVFGSGGSTYNTLQSAATNYNIANTTSSIALTSNQTNATSMTNYRCEGIVSINAGGTFIPQYALSAAPGGAYTTQVGSYFLIYPIGASGSNVSVGTWA